MFRTIANSCSLERGHFFWLLMLGMAFCLVFQASVAEAQVRSSSRIELNDQKNRVSIGQNIHITKDPQGTLSEKTLLSRHINNLRGVKQKSDILRLGLSHDPVWMVFSVKNQAAHEKWALDFGDLMGGRTGFVKKLYIRNTTSGEVISKILGDGNDVGVQNVAGSGVFLNIPRGKPQVFVVYLETTGSFAQNFVPSLVTQKAFIQDFGGSDFLNVLVNIGFLAILGFSLGLTIAYRSRSSLLFMGSVLCFSMLFLVLNSMFVVGGGFSLVLIAGLFVLASLVSLVFCKFFLEIGIEDHAENVLIWGAGAISLVSFMLYIFVHGGVSVFDEMLLFLPGLAAFGAMAAVSFTQGQRGKFGAYALAWGWLAAFGGFFISGLSMGGLFPVSSFTLNAFWYSFFGLSAAIGSALYIKTQMVRAQQQQILARESRAARSVERLQHSKESADQARLLRVIERERELMAELREREIQRTEEMRQAKDMADEANRAKSAFLAVVSHEIRTPMTGIMGMVRLLLDSKMSKEQNEYVQAVQNSGDTMMALLNDILDFEKIESGSMELEAIDCDLPRLVQGVVTLMSGHAAEKEVQLAMEVANDFPVPLVGDPTRLRQVLLNLVNNAIKFTPRGQVKIIMKAGILGNAVQDSAQNYEVYFAIEDTGIGISEEAQEKLFSPFSQADSSTSREYGGTGLGLAISRRLIEAMGSTIHVKSVEGEGSTFFFSVTMAEGSRDALIDEEQAAGEKAPVKAPPMNILAIEDNEMNRKVLHGFLSKEGHTVTMAASGERGIGYFERHAF